MSDPVDPKHLAALHWFGYGQWSSPFWFIGMEPGGTDEDASYETWVSLGGGELIDCRQHHLQSGYTKWHGRERPPTQATWRRLIQVLLAFENKPSGLEEVREFQRDFFGGIAGNAALIELSALHSRSLKDEVDREAHRAARSALITERLDHYHPKVALFYGSSYRTEYEQIAGGQFGPDGMCWRATTLCVLVRHPTARSDKGPSYWIELGYSLRMKVLNHKVEG